MIIRMRMGFINTTPPSLRITFFTVEKQIIPAISLKHSPVNITTISYT